MADIGQSDAEITALAVGEGRTIVTLDSDFHRLLAISGASAPIATFSGRPFFAAEPGISRMRAMMVPQATQSLLVDRPTDQEQCDQHTEYGQ